MRLVIDDADFRRLPLDMQRELVRRLGGRELLQSEPHSKTPPERWNTPIDLTHELTLQLMHGLGEDHRRRLEVFARQNGRASMKDLLKVTNDNDWHVLSYFQAVVTRKLRRILGDNEKKVFLIGWDYGATKWNKDHTQILDGVYYVSDATTQCPREHFHTG